MKVFVQIVDTSNGNYQHALIDEPVKADFEVANAIAHLVGHVKVEWNSDFIHKDLVNKPRLMTGIVSETNKIINIVCYEESVSSKK